MDPNLTRTADDTAQPNFLIPKKLSPPPVRLLYNCLIVFFVQGCSKIVASSFGVNRERPIAGT